jgi:hypothetical protein
MVFISLTCNLASSSPYHYYSAVYQLIHNLYYNTSPVQFHNSVIILWSISPLHFLKVLQIINLFTGLCIFFWVDTQFSKWTYTYIHLRNSADDILQYHTNCIKSSEVISYVSMEAVTVSETLKTSNIHSWLPEKTLLQSVNMKALAPQIH